MADTAAFKPCLLIPIYNHGTLIEATLASLAAYQLPCLLIDDGSDEATARLLDAIVARESAWIHLFRLPKNSGKGAAVMRGFAEAQRLGFSHALQIDADGQHNTADIPALLAMAAAEPDALISGAPQYDASVPKSRFYGRYITHFWVWIETLSFAIRDSMCGFRVYPVAITHELTQSENINSRMGFDTEIMVRLYWAGTAVRFLDTRVLYPENGVSHFKLLRDNVQISLMHSRLFFGMLLRLPRLLLQKNLSQKKLAQKKRGEDKGQTHWSKQKESGSYSGMLISLWIYRLLGTRALYLLLYPIIAWYFIVNRSARTESRRYLQRVLDHPVRPIHIYKHLMAFGRYIVDRLAAWNGSIKDSAINFENQSMLKQQAARGKGAVILTSHLGGVEVCRAMLQNLPGIYMNILGYTGNAQKINHILEKNAPNTNTHSDSDTHNKTSPLKSGFEMIQITDVGPDTAIMLHDKIQRGEFVVMTADRTSPNSQHRVSTAPFFGELAAFSHGPFILAALLECPVYLLFVLPSVDEKNRQNQYTVHLELFAEQLVLPRKQRSMLLDETISRYAARLEHYCRQAPYQWFNFFNFWQRTNPPAHSATHPHIQSARVSRNKFS